jgi:hypothetical protein
MALLGRRSAFGGSRRGWLAGLRAAGQAATGQHDAGHLPHRAPDRAGRGAQPRKRRRRRQPLPLHQHPLGLLDHHTMAQRPLQLLGQLPLSPWPPRRRATGWPPPRRRPATRRPRCRSSPAGRPHTPPRCRSGRRQAPPAHSAPPAARPPPAPGRPRPSAARCPHRRPPPGPAAARRPCRGRRQAGFWAVSARSARASDALAQVSTSPSPGSISPAPSAPIAAWPRPPPAGGPGEALGDVQGGQGADAVGQRSGFDAHRPRPPATRWQPPRQRPAASVSSASPAMAVAGP